MKGKMCRWRGRGANEEEDVPMKRKMCQWSGICAHEGEDVPMKGKMCPWRGRCANEAKDVAMKMWQLSFQEVENKSVRESISRKQASRESARKHPSTKNGLRVSLRAGCPPVYRAVTTKKNTAQMGVGWFNRQLYRCSYLFIHLFIYSFSFFGGGAIFSLVSIFGF